MLIGDVFITGIFKSTSTINIEMARKNGYFVSVSPFCWIDREKKAETIIPMGAPAVCLLNGMAAKPSINISNVYMCKENRIQCICYL